MQSMMQNTKQQRRLKRVIFIIFLFVSVITVLFALSGNGREKDARAMSSRGSGSRMCSRRRHRRWERRRFRHFCAEGSAEIRKRYFAKATTTSA